MVEGRGRPQLECGKPTAVSWSGALTQRKFVLRVRLRPFARQAGDDRRHLRTTRWREEGRAKASFVPDRWGTVRLRSVGPSYRHPGGRQLSRSSRKLSRPEGLCARKRHRPTVADPLREGSAKPPQAVGLRLRVRPEARATSWTNHYPRNASTTGGAPRPAWADHVGGRMRRRAFREIRVTING